MLLGGSSQQVIAIKRAKALGLYTVLCDFLEDNPGQYEADKFYLVSTTDKDAVLEVARKENVNGIVAYSSDPAAPTAAYVAEKMRLPGVPYQVAEAFCNKILFREFLELNGFNVPSSVEIDANSDSSIVEGLHLPIIIKPTDSSGSKGVTVIDDISEFYKARDFANDFSRNGVLIAEEYIVRDHEDVIETEIFVLNGEVVSWGIMSSVRDKYTNPLIPAAYSYPVTISDDRFNVVKAEVSRLVRVTKVQNGAFNIEMVITKENKLYFLDAGPRNGGNMLPEYIGMISNSDLVEATIKAAMGESDKIHGIELDGLSGGYHGLYVIHSNKEGVLTSIKYKGETCNYLQRQHLFEPIGSHVKPFENSRDAIGLAFFRFPDKDTRDNVLRDFTGKYIELGIE